MFFQALVELVVACPFLTVSHLTSLFYAQNQTLQQRMDVLDVLCAAAVRLSKSEDVSSSASSVVSSSQSVALSKADSSVDPFAISRARVESRTRRWTKRIEQKKMLCQSKFGDFLFLPISLQILDFMFLMASFFLLDFF